MYIYLARYLTGISDDGEPEYVSRQFDDSGILLDCVAESVSDVWCYFLNAALKTAADEGWKLDALECVAD